MPVYLRTRASLTRATLSGSVAAIVRGRQRPVARVDRDRRVGDRLAVPARGRAVDRTDEGVVAVDDDPDDRPVGGAIGSRGLDLDLFGRVEQGELAGIEAHGASVAHLGCGTLDDMQRYDPLTALIVVDVQNDFADPAGGLVGRRAATAIVPIDQPRDRRWPATPARSSSTPRTGTPTSTPHFAKDGGIWPVHCVADTWGAELHPDLDRPTGPIVRKGANGEDGYSGFTMRDPVTGETIPTELEGLLRERGDRAGRRVRPRDRLLRQGDGARRGAARLRDSVLTDAVAAVNLRARRRRRGRSTRCASRRRVWQQPG